jgi:hypothetical protein
VAAFWAAVLPIYLGYIGQLFFFGSTREHSSHLDVEAGVNVKNVFIAGRGDNHASV